MANYPVDPAPHVPPGMTAIPPGPLRTQRSYVFLGGDSPINVDDWVVATLTPEPDAAEYIGSIAIIGEFLHGLGLQVRSTSKSAMGTALFWFATVTDRDA